jgi:hypothetical protein
MKSFARYIVAAAVVAFLATNAAHAELTSADQAEVFKAAGFKKARSGQYVRCREEPPTTSYTPGRIELVDLNGDGQPEAWVTESSTYCYGNTAESFVLLTKDSGRWRVLLQEVGIAVPLKSKHRGWPDIEVGGPGFGKFPVYRWDGKSYVLRK